MGVYAVTGGSNGIGAKTISILKQKGHETINIDWKRGDIEADLSLPEGRQKAIDELFSLCPQGLDGLILCAGIPGSRKDLRLILSVNYFGTISIIKGAYDLLKQKNGACVISASSAISREDMKTDLVDLLNNNRDDEYRILEVIGRMDGADLNTGDQIYAASKYAPLEAPPLCLLCRQRRSDQCRGSWECKHPYDSDRVKGYGSGLKCPSDPHKVRHKKADGSGRNRFCDHISHLS